LLRDHPAVRTDFNLVSICAKSSAGPTIRVLVEQSQSNEETSKRVRTRAIFRREYITLTRASATTRLKSTKQVENLSIDPRVQRFGPQPRYEDLGLASNGHQHVEP